jgi:hypothetical protein
MDVAALLLELYGRVPPLVENVVDGLRVDELTAQPFPGANTIAWLVWHLTRVQDDHVAEMLDADQVWVGGSVAGDFGLDPDPSNTGYGHSAEDVTSIRPERPEVLFEYFSVVDARTSTMLESLAPADLDRVVDTRWDPPVTLGVRLVSIADDSLQHVGQAAYLRGLIRP